ncbi:hypothetical protein DMB38_32295 [Streptomyces sp. WAC 06738]|nr:hypothetical protein DMB38_32295 [Streptomyces sp. WAC 06738]
MEARDVTTERREEAVPEFRDERHFGLLVYRPNYPCAVFRGTPPLEDLDVDDTLVVRDILFSDLWRISSWNDLGPVHLRRAAPPERAELEGRLGEIRAGHEIYLLEAGSVETYVIAGGVTWADYELESALRESPLLERAADRRAPVDGVVRYGR